MEQEYAPPEETTQKKYIRNYTEEGREKQKNHLNNIRQKAMEKKRELKEITLKAKLMKLEPKIELAKQYDDYVNNKPQIPEPEQIVYIPKSAKQKQKKIIYKEVEEEEEVEEIVYIKKNKPKPQESIEKTLYKSSTEQLHMRALELAPSGTSRDGRVTSVVQVSARHMGRSRSVQCAADGDRARRVLPRTAVGVAVPFTCQTALVRCAKRRAGPNSGTSTR